MQLAGPNGAGKTSLLRIIAGFAMPDEGDVFYQERSITKYYDEYAQELMFIGHKTGLTKAYAMMVADRAPCADHGIQAAPPYFIVEFFASRLALRRTSKCEIDRTTVRIGMRKMSHDHDHWRNGVPNSLIEGQ